MNSREKNRLSVSWRVIQNGTGSVFRLVKEVVNMNNEECAEMFVKAIVSYLLDDENSPNEIDEKETEWLYNKIKGDGTVDKTEKELLLTLKSRAKIFPSRLEELL